MPNGSRVLSSFGFSFERARACKLGHWDTFSGDSMKRVASLDLNMAENGFGFPCWSVHRVDLHNELLHLAMSENGTDLKPVILHLGAQVVDASTDGSITLKDGSRHTADLVVAADGLKSVLRKTVLTCDADEPAPSGLSAFRFLIDTKLLEEDAELASVLEERGSNIGLLFDAKYIGNPRHMVWYPCRGWVTHLSTELPNFRC